MALEQDFWKRASEERGQDFWVCMSCLNEVFWRKIPKPDCPTCHGYSTYESFTFQKIQEWGTEELIESASKVRAQAIADILKVDNTV